MTLPQMCIFWLILIIEAQPRWSHPWQSDQLEIFYRRKGLGVSVWFKLVRSPQRTWFKFYWFAILNRLSSITRHNRFGRNIFFFPCFFFCNDSIEDLDHMLFFSFLLVLFLQMFWHNVLIKCICTINGKVLCKAAVFARRGFLPVL